MITVWGTGRGFRVVWLLEEIGLPYRVRPVDLLAGVKNDSEFLAIIVQEFTPTSEEQELSALVADYLRRPNLKALPDGQRQLISLVLWKLLASSTHAIAGALETMAKRLHSVLDEASRNSGVRLCPPESAGCAFACTNPDALSHAVRAANAAKPAAVLRLVISEFTCRPGPARAATANRR